MRARDAAGNWSDAVTVTVNVVDPNLADVAIAGSSTPDPARLGETYRVNLTIGNHGPRDVGSVSTTTGFDGTGFTVLDVTPSQGTCVTGPAPACDSERWHRARRPP